MDSEDETQGIIDTRERVVTFQLSALPSTSTSTTPVHKSRRTLSTRSSSGWFLLCFKMWCGRLCILLVFLTLLILGVVFPVSLQQHGNGREELNMLHGYPNSGDRFGGHGVDIHGPGHVPGHGHNGQHGHGHGGHNEDVAPPTATENDGNVEGREGTPITLASSGGEEQDGDEIRQGEPKFHMKVFGDPARHRHGESAATAATDFETGSGNDNLNSGTQCNSQGQSKQIEDKLESLVTSVAHLQKSLEKMENLIQGTAVDEQLSKCVEAISAGNQSLAVKHWTNVLKYETKDKPKTSFLTRIIKDAYNGHEQRILNVADFIQETRECTGFSVLYDEMKNYGHVFGGHSQVFLLGHKIKQSCGESGPPFEALPSAVKAILKGTFTLQNKFNKGYLYYAKRCVAKHYYHCLDVLTKTISPEEFKSLESEGDEWWRYHWKINASDATAKEFTILNQDKFWSYRLQDLKNSPRFRMEEAGSGFEVDMSRFQLMLQSEEEIKIQVRDTNAFLEGEEIRPGTTELLLHSFHKGTDDKQPESDKIYWLVKAGEDVGRLRRSW